MKMITSEPPIHFESSFEAEDKFDNGSRLFQICIFTLGVYLVDLDLAILRLVLN